jgi:hypothetical protein
LRTADNARSKWLLELATAERKQFAALSELQRKVYETRMAIARNIGPGGNWQYNSATGKYDRWVPDR